MSYFKKSINFYDKNQNKIGMANVISQNQVNQISINLYKKLDNSYLMVVDNSKKYQKIIINNGLLSSSVDLTQCAVFLFSNDLEIACAVTADFDIEKAREIVRGNDSQKEKLNINKAEEVHFDDEIKDGKNIISLNDEVIDGAFDGQVATVNYFENDLPKEVAQDAKKIVEVKNCEKEFAEKAISDDKNDQSMPKTKIFERTFYLEILDQLNALFEDHKEDEYLNSIIPNSSWVKISYDSDRFYSVGILKEDGEVKYIGYAVPSDYSETPPVELGNNAQFVPLNFDNPKGKGYFMIYQKAEDGSSL